MLVWGWPILFVGLGIGFFQMIPLGGVFVGMLCGILFVVMGLAPLMFELRAGPRRIVLGKTNVRDQRFTDKRERAAHLLRLRPRGSRRRPSLRRRATGC